MQKTRTAGETLKWTHQEAQVRVLGVERQQRTAAVRPGTLIYFLTAAFLLPETKGKTLEEIEGFFSRERG